MTERRRSGRTLRSPRLRAMIWRSQGGICGECGEPMDPSEDWEIDHVEPWRITHRTNIFELQATHRRCNRQKGGRASMEIRRWELLRKGQRDAIETVESRVGRRTDTTAIVLPCRYGKSDVIRLAAVKLWADGKVCTSLGLSPGEILRDQLGDHARWTAAFKRYGVVTKSEPQIATLDKPKAGIRCKFNPNGEAFLSATIQLVQNNISDFAAWIESEVHRIGLPVLVFIDECHSNSTENEWGKIVPALIEAGAHIVLLTATPERHDQARIPGFDFDIVDEGEVKIYRTRPNRENPDLVTVEMFQGRKQKFRLKPDLEVTFGEAWKEDTGGEPILCKISRTTFDVRLSGAGIDDADVTWLSEIDQPEKVKRYLGPLTRHHLVIDEGCRRLIVGLEARRRLLPGFQAIVYCGNDIEQGDERQENKHGEAIKAGILRHGPGLAVVVATSVNGGKELIESFAKGQGDVLIVKQMAAMGLDLPLVKIGLDLSATRTFPGLVQRMFRPATPHAGAVACEWITPEDVISAVYFDRIVTQAGGEAKATDLELVESYDKKKKERERDSRLSVDEVKDGRFGDSAGRNAEPEQWELVAELMTSAPKITSVYTHAEIVEIAESLRSARTETGADEEEATPVKSTSISAVALRGEINEAAKLATGNYMRDKGLAYQGNYFSRAIEAIWGNAKRAADWPRGVELSASDDLGDLLRLRDVMDEMSKRSWND